jgi:alpha-beta hydrolase superfamily lysophospholipase
VFLHGTLDKNARPSGGQHFYDMASSTDKKVKFYGAGFHDLLNDIDKALVIQGIKGWINTRLPATLSTPVLAEAAAPGERYEDSGESAVVRS